MRQRGFSVIFILAFAAVLAISILALGIYVLQKPGKKPVNNKSVMPKQDCIHTSLGGCDNDQNFYKWKDDGLP